MVKSLKPNENRAKNSILIFIIFLVLNSISLLSDVMQYEMLQTDFTTEEAESNDYRQMIITIFLVIILIFCAIVFIMWFRRAYYNLHTRVID